MQRQCLNDKNRVLSQIKGEWRVWCQSQQKWANVFLSQWETHKITVWEESADALSSALRYPSARFLKFKFQKQNLKVYNQDYILKELNANIPCNFNG